MIYFTFSTIPSPISELIEKLSKEWIMCSTYILYETSNPMWVIPLKIYKAYVLANVSILDVSKFCWWMLPKFPVLIYDYSHERGKFSLFMPGAPGSVCSSSAKENRQPCLYLLREYSMKLIETQ